MRPINFRFDPEKFVAALTYFASHGVPDLDVMKANKLLYFADKAHLLKYGRPISGDDYYGMEHGPVPSNAYNVIKAAIAKDNALPLGLFERYLEVQPTSGNLHQIVARESPDMDVLSDSDVEILDQTIEKYGPLPALRLRDLAHEEPDYRDAEEQLRPGRASVAMPYRSFFSERDRAMLAAVEEDQETDKFAESLTW